MPFFISLILIGVLAFAAFCFYCGVKTVGEKIKKDGLLPTLEWVLIVWFVTGVIILVTARVSGVLFNTMPTQQSRTFQV